MKFQFWSRGLYISGLNALGGYKFVILHVCSYLRLKHKLSILSRLSDFVVHIKHSKGSISQLLNTVKR